MLLIFYIDDNTVQIAEHRFVKSYYESRVDWKAKTDYLRCSPNFYSQERYDCVIIHNTERDFFARLGFIFTYSFEGVVLPIALVHPFSEVLTPRNKDKALNLHRVRMRPRADAMFVSVRSICRGAFLVAENCKDGDFLVVDVVDTDMFLRIRSMYPPWESST
jgi:hypothetical protein